jgi:hypothetical protein
MHIIGAALTGLLVLTAASAQAVQSTNDRNCRPLGTALSFGLNYQAGGDSLRRVLRRDWLGELWWGPCGPNR